MQIKLLIIAILISCLIMLIKIVRDNRINIKFLDLTKKPFKRVTMGTQRAKCREEFKEFIYPNNRENEIEEFYDLMQSSLNLMQLRGITMGEITKGQYLHHAKMKKRGYKLIWI